MPASAVVEKDAVSRSIVIYERGCPHKRALSIRLMYPNMCMYDLRSKTVALLVRGDDKRLMASVSGWGRTPNQPCQLDGEYWTNRVIDLSEIIGHRLVEDSERDQGRPGRAAASHAEKQLAAFYHDQYDWREDAVIHISWKVCSDCLHYFFLLRQKFQLGVTLIVNGAVTRY